MAFDELLRKAMEAKELGDRPKIIHYNPHQTEADRIKNELLSKLSVDKYNRKVQLNKEFWEDEK